MKFDFGKNWLNYSKKIDAEKIDQSIKSISNFMGLENFEGKSFLDIGSGSGLSSIAANNMDAKVFAFDENKNSVLATKKNLSEFSKTDEWHVEIGSVLDMDYMTNLSKYDIVYSWGVLHHTGQMWEALENISNKTNENGYLYIAIYNDQGGASKRWLVVKKIYNFSPNFIKWLLIMFFYLYFELGRFAAKLIRLENPFTFFTKNHDKQPERGMSRWYDLIDWVGGYPFEVATPEEIIHFYLGKGFKLKKLKTCGGGLGCNEYLFIKEPKA